jgi:hypothetical protein
MSAAPPRASLAVALLALAASWGTLALPEPTARRLIAENGPVEMASAGGYALATVAAAVLGHRLGWPAPRLVAGALGLLLLRELDFQDRFTTKNIDEVAFFRSPRVPPAEKLVVGGVYLGLAAFALWFLRRTAPPWARALRRGEPWAGTVLGAGLMLVAAQVMDRLAVPAKRRWGSPANLAMHAGEEVFELAVPVLLLVALWQAARRPRAAPALPRAGSGVQGP